MYSRLLPIDRLYAYLDNTIPNIVTMVTILYAPYANIVKSPLPTFYKVKLPAAFLAGGS